MKKGLAGRIYRLCPVRHGILLLSALIIGLHLATRENHDLNRALSERVVRPIHRSLSQWTAKLPFSVAEVLIGFAGIALLVYIIYSAIMLITRKERAKRVYIICISLTCFGLAVYAGFCLLWGVYYYGDDFSARSGLEAEPVSARDLAEVTAYFADLCNRYGEQVPRNGKGAYTGDREAVLERSSQVYLQAQERFPFLEGPAVPAKGVHFSRLLSYTDFTGFFFPFTAEANVNTDFPPGLFPATVAHELAHQRGVAKEQEANFVAVLACLEYGDAEYCYSAALLAYTHLSNALFKADRAAWQRISACLSPQVRRDFAVDRAYWRRFETPVQSVSNTVYEGFLYSYDQDLGLKSYGACVDLLVNYYRAAAHGQ